MFDKIKSAVAGPDPAETLRGVLGDDALLAFVPVMASGSAVASPNKRPRDLGELAGKAANRLKDTYIADQHVGGDDGTIARSLPNTTDILVLALAEKSISLWSFGPTGRRTDPDLVARIPREQVASIADTGKRTVRGHVRLSFTDGSFFDEQTLKAPSQEFWTAAEAYGRG
ncbi:hypothetical protein [Aeromicrobium endophyticum]|nr:hypothetical protein [Aeromicrobium endophyticum]